MAIEVIIARTKQQIEQGFAVREQTMVCGEGVPYDVEFDDNSAENPVYFLALSGGEALGTCRAVKIDARKNISVQSNVAGQGNAFGWADAAAVEERFADTVKLERIAVLSNRQHGGIGTALIKGAEDILRREGVKKIIINSRDKALGFYERLEYRRMSAADVEYCLALLPKVSRYEAKNRCGAADVLAVPDCVDDRGFPGYLVEHIL